MCQKHQYFDFIKIVLNRIIIHTTMTYHTFAFFYITDDSVRIRIGQRIL